MKLVVVIPTLGRCGQVTRLLAHLDRQTRRPDAVIVSAPDPTHVERFPLSSFPVSAIFGPKGLAAQRNSALEAVAGKFDIVTFFDDDFVPADDYLDGIVSAFTAHREWSVVMGRVVLDGATGAGFDWDDALTALAETSQKPPPLPAIIEHVGAYGCNMSIRAAAIGPLRFDERLALYGWQEDIDFTSQMRAHGRCVQLSHLRGVHLGLKSGRVSGERFGYSQIVNPIYLVRKGTVPASFALPLMLRNIAANLFRSLRPEPHVDRRGRLRGNLLAFAHLLRGRVEPEYIVNIQRIRWWP
ncbi:glycosyltransferase family 2 protein [Pararhizobium haloflavum]|uniref:glycosyltransferase family 2 protein n=1 Tax=Pararhizobium haloflavum TaxID=2037914 RepID=UPI000C1A19DE|nr:glycosyltransferase [Pararhizobium haloflavum]